jgi:putative phage-type endonuclease
MHSMDQRSADWHAVRLGKATASRISDVVAKLKDGKTPGAGRKNYAAELMLERLTGVPKMIPCTAAMQHGIDTEAEARAAYEKHALCGVTEVGFCDHPTIPMSGASPDGLVGTDGLVEITCPQPATHFETLEAKAVPSQYVTQIMWQLACTQRQWCDFVSYQPDMPEEMRLIVIRLHRCDDTIAELEAEVAKFLTEVETRLASVRAQYQPQKELAA